MCKKVVLVGILAQIYQIPLIKVLIFAKKENEQYSLSRTNAPQMP